MTTETIQLAHGGGGRLTREFVEREILTRFGDGPLAGLPDGARLPRPAGAMVFTTDSFVVQPLEFPGGNIGDLAVHGTVNDLAVCGARPRWLSLALIIEEGMPLDRLRRLLDAVRTAASACGVMVVTGDTKVVARGQCDGLYVNSAGIGDAIPGFDLSPNHLREGDVVLVSGPLADHGMAILAAREGLAVGHALVSDTAPVHRLVEAMAPRAAAVRWMRDPTRGGAAATLNELVDGRSFDVRLREQDLPFSPGAQAVADLLGIDPLHVASEGRLIAVCASEAGEAILHAWRARPEGRGAAGIGTIAATADGRGGRVILETVTGGRRLVDVPRGELLPRIC